MTDHDDLDLDLGPEPPDDAALEQLAGAVSALLAADPVPPAVLEGAKAAWTWRSIDAELAELLEEESLAVRGTAVAGPVAYGASGVVIDLERGLDSIVGQVSVPEGRAATAAGLLRPSGESDPVALDGAGGFRAAVEPGPARFWVDLDDGSTIVTPWL